MYQPLFSVTVFSWFCPGFHCSTGSSTYADDLTRICPFLPFFYALFFNFTVCEKILIEIKPAERRLAFLIYLLQSS